jgi:hypothetical protein
MPLLQDAPRCWGGQRRASCWPACWCSWPAIELLNIRSSCWHINWVPLLQEERVLRENAVDFGNSEHRTCRLLVPILGELKLFVLIKILPKSWEFLLVSCYKFNLPRFLTYHKVCLWCGIYHEVRLCSKVIISSILDPVCSNCEPHP